MKKNTHLLIFTLLLSLGLSACATTGMYSSTGVALVSAFREGVTATSNPGDKHGEACSMNILGIAAVGDGSIEAAKKNGNITQVATVDRDIMNVLLLFGKNCTLVTGR